MLELNYKGKSSELVKMRNIAEKLDVEDLRAIGSLCRDEFEKDKTSRSAWESWQADAMKLALQVMEQKSFPWPNCANVKLPLITIAALNFHARAYSGLIKGDSVVEYRPIGEDKDGKLLASSKRVSRHQNFMLLQGSTWEEQVDRGLINLSIIGCCFKKTFYDHDKRMVVSDLRLAMDIVVPYYTKSLSTCPRISETFSLTPNQFKTRLRRKQYLDYVEEGYGDYSPNWGQVSSDPLVAARNQAQQTPETASYDSGAPAEFVEQHRFLDLDGDGYEEPYIVTFVRATGQVCRIVARYNKKDIEFVKDKDDNEVIAYIEPTHYYTKYSFIPSPDGGFYDLGFGMLLSPLNYACDSLINQLLDAGTMHNLGGGFISRGVKIRKGETTFEPNEWKVVDSTGLSLKDNIVPLPVRDPSQVLLDLLVFLVQYSERVGGANEIQMGELPGQNAKTGALEIANQNGLKVYGAIYKRLWRCFRDEFVTIYKTTSVYSEAVDMGARDVNGNWFQIQSGDYTLPADGIWPIANPNVASPEEEQKQAMMVFNTAMAVPGQNVYVATMRMYKAFNVPNPEEIFPDPKDPKVAIQPQPDAKLLDANSRALLAQARLQEVQYQRTVAISEALRKIEESQARIAQLYAQASALQAEAKSKPVGQAIALIDAEIAARKHSMEALLKLIDTLKQEGANSGIESVGATGDTGIAKLPLMAGAGGDTKVLPLSPRPEGANEGSLGTA